MKMASESIAQAYGEGITFADVILQGDNLFYKDVTYGDLYSDVRVK